MDRSASGVWLRSAQDFLPGLMHDCVRHIELFSPFKVFFATCLSGHLCTFLTLQFRFLNSIPLFCRLSSDLWLLFLTDEAQRFLYDKSLQDHQDAVQCYSKGGCLQGRTHQVRRAGYNILTLSLLRRCRAKEEAVSQGGKIINEFVLIQGFTYAQCAHVQDVESTDISSSVEYPDDHVGVLKTNDHITVEEDGEVTTQ
jgi:hypothetical protein